MLKLLLVLAVIAVVAVLVARTRRSSAAASDGHASVGEARAAKATTDQAKRKDYIWEMQRMLHEQGGALIPLFKDWLDVHDVKVKGHTPHGMFDLCNSRIVQKAWIEA